MAKKSKVSFFGCNCPQTKLPLKIKYCHIDYNKTKIVYPLSTIIGITGLLFAKPVLTITDV